MKHRLRPTAQLVARYRNARDPYGWVRDVVYPYLPYADATALTACTEEQWAGMQHEYTLPNVKADATVYLGYAWHALLKHRNVESQRSVIKLNTYCWLLGAPQRDFFAGKEGLYGIEGLQRASSMLDCEFPPATSRIGINMEPTPIPPSDISRIIRMANGEPCLQWCEGCRWEPE